MSNFGIWELPHRLFNLLLAVSNAYRIIAIKMFTLKIYE